MRFLLDTHVVLWCISLPERLSLSAREMITNGNNLVYVSAASLWEMAIKKSHGKLIMPYDIEEEMKTYRFLPLPVTFRHVLTIEELPKIHKDPFDRLLVAQAKEEGLALVTDDNIIPKYPGINVIKT